MEDTPSFIPTVYDFFEKSARMIFSHMRKRKCEVRSKGAEGLVSGFDREMHRMLTRFMRGCFPGYEILSEEEKYTWPPKTKKAILIDPLDGTHNYLCGLPNFGTMIAGIEDGLVTFSIVYLPVEQMLFNRGFTYAIRGGGAWQSTDDDLRRFRPIHVAREWPQKESMLFLDGRSKLMDGDGSGRVGANRLKRALRRSRQGLSLAWDAVLLASGSDYPVPAVAFASFGCQPHDNIPPCLLVEEAGGKVTDFSGNPWSLKNCSNLVYSNGVIHDSLLRVLKEKTR